MQLGLTWPLQRYLRVSVPYGEPAPLAQCWDLHRILLRGRGSLLLVHCASRYTCVRFDMTSADWADLPRTAMEEIRLGLLDAGLEPEQVDAYLSAAGEPVRTRTHGRRPVAFLNRAWEDVLSADLLADQSQQRQPLLNSAVNDGLCRCAGFEGQDTALAFLRRCFSEERNVP